METPATTTKPDTMKIAFTGSSNSFNIYGGTVDLGPYTYAHIVKQDTKAKSLRVMFYTSLEEAAARHGEDIRKVSATTAKSKGEAAPDAKLYKTITGSTAIYMGFARKRDYRFGRMDVPVHQIAKTDTMATYDIDLTGETIRNMIRNGAVSTKSVAATQRALAKPAKATTAPTKIPEVSVPEKPTAVSIARGSVANHLTLAAGTTVADLQRMNFQVVILDAAENPFVVDTL